MTHATHLNTYECKDKKYFTIKTVCVKKKYFWMKKVKNLIKLKSLL